MPERLVVMTDLADIERQINRVRWYEYALSSSIVSKNDEFCIKTRNFVSKTRNYVSKTMNCVFQIDEFCR